jgi:hypothetical protein
MNNGYLFEKIVLVVDLREWEIQTQFKTNVVENVL